MRRLLVTVFCLIALLGLLPSPAMAQSNVPLVVIRFNQDRVMFERQLYNAIAKAVEIKPTVVMDVVSFLPETGNDRLNEKLHAKASGETARVVNSLVSMGIPKERMHVSQEAGAGLQYHEVHVYVE